jgi:hypothetical protein
MNHLRPAAIIVALAALAATGCPANTQAPCPAGSSPGVGGCIPNYSASRPPTVGSPGPSASLPPGTGTYSDPGIEVLGGSLTVTVSDAKGNHATGAHLRLYGPTMTTTDVNAAGQATLGPLAIGAGYRLIVSGNGFASQQVDGIEIKKKSETRQSVTLAPEAVLSGRVTQGAQPVVAAVVSDGLNSALTDTQGNYQLHGVGIGQVTLSASKSRLQTATRAVAVTGSGAGAQDLSLNAGQSIIYFDSSVAPGIDLTRFSLMQKALTDQGWTISPTPPDHEGVWVLICPTKALPDAVQTRIVSFVAQGGKLVMFGEWGGFGLFNNPGANGLAHAVGLHFNPDLVRDPSVNPTHPEWLSLTSFQAANPALQAVKTVKMYAACSLFGLAPMTVWAQTSPTGYRVQDNAVAGLQPMIMAGPFKGGKAIALGNASGFSDEDTAGNGIPNIKEANNLELVGQLFNW